MYFAIYQALAKDERRPGLYREYPRDFFDLIIVDECHRGSARDESNWREILEYFEPASQLGMTATPLREDNRDTYRYFHNPLYTYSLRQGIDDGFLAPYRVHRIVSTVDAAGWRPTPGEVDRYGREIPDSLYATPDFDRLIALKARTEAIARNLTDFLKKSDRFAKTIVFCVDQEHAEEMRRALNNCNSDLVKQYPDYVARVVSDEGDIGRSHLSRFMELETTTPAILTTSQMLTTGVDVAAPLDLDIVDVLRIDLRAKIAGNVGVWNLNAVDEPAHLMATSHVQHVVRHVGSGHVVGDHRHAVGPVRAGGLGDLLPADQCGWRDCIHI
jgi:type I restriction enzyme, R subunit